VRRWIPYSLLFHLLMLVVMIWFGSFVDPPRQRPQKVIRVTLRQEPREEPVQQPRQETPVVAAEPEVVRPEPEPEKQREEPAKLPEVKPEQKPVREDPEPQPQEPQPEQRDDTPVEPLEDAPAPVPERSQVAATDQPFPYQYYFGLIEGGIARKWQPKRLGFRDRSSRTCTVHFFIERNGLITRETIVESSGIPLFDREALQAVKSVRRFPPLPGGFSTGSLGVTFVFTLRSGL